MKRRYEGGCHCGAVRFQAEVDLAAGTFKCNCSMCTKTRMWSAVVQPGTFRLLSGESELVDYKPFGNHNLFCRRCGVRSFSWGENDSGERFYVVRVACLDDVDVDELVSAPVTYFDGRNDDFQSTPAETRHL